MNIYVFLLIRLVHIVAGSLWVGAAVFYLFFIKPSVKSIGPAGPQFMQNLTARRRYPVYMSVASLLTIAAGIILYVYDSGGLNADWMRSGPGLGYTIGGVAGLAAFLVGSLVIGPTAGKMGTLGQQIAAAGGSPAPEQVSQIHALESRLEMAEKVDFWMLTIAMLTMASARFWVF